MNNTFSDLTKKICLFSLTSLILIIFFMITPLKHFYFTASFMKVIILLILGYTIYLNIIQTEKIRNSKTKGDSSAVQSQIRINAIGGYIFTGLLGLLIIFIIKTFITK
jgi:hypothetical protein